MIKLKTNTPRFFEVVYFEHYRNLKNDNVLSTFMYLGDFNNLN